MGLKPGQGLGKHNQGIVKPIEESNQKGRSGIGFKVESNDQKVDTWNFEADSVISTSELL